MQIEKNESVRLIADVNPTGFPGFDDCQSINQELINAVKQLRDQDFE